MRRRTLRRSVTVPGVSLRTFARVSVTLNPAEPGSGIIINDRWNATVQNASVVDHATRIGRGKHAVGMVEHLLATCAAFGLTDLAVGVDGDSLPFGDGSCRQMAEKIRDAGTKVLAGEVRSLDLAKPVIVESSAGFIAAVPSTRFRVHCLAHPGGGAAMLFSTTGQRAAFSRDLAGARTFGPTPAGVSAAALGRKLGLGFRLKTEYGMVRPARLRFPDELCRHKVVDLLGDLALLGRPIRAEVFAFQPGHRLNHRFVRLLRRETEAG